MLRLLRPGMCELCDGPFMSRSLGAMYCSRDCANRAQKRVDPDRAEKRCPRCMETKRRDAFYKSRHTNDGMTQRAASAH